MPGTAELTALRPVMAVAQADFEAMRTIRNSGRRWYTRFQGEISHGVQRSWRALALQSRDTLRPYVYEAEGGGIVAYGLLREERGRWYVTLGVAPEDQGQGYGTEVYRHLAEEARADVYAEILRENVASLVAAGRAGYELAEQDGRTVTMVRRWQR